MMSIKKNKTYIDEFKKIPVDMVIASGRATYGIIQVVNKCNMQDKFKYVIGHNGGQIYNIVDNKVVYSKPFEEELFKKLFQYISSKEYNIAIGVRDWEKIYVYKNNEHTKRECSVNFIKLCEITDYNDFPKEKIKMMLFMNNETQTLMYNELEKSEFNGLVEFTKSGNDLIEITVKGVNKATALEKLSKKLNISLDNIIAFGNAQNDIEMLKEVGYGYAMKNSEQCVLEVAKYITEYTNNDCGVEREILKIFKRWEKK